MEKILRLSQTSLGIEFGSTRIKGVLIDGHGHTIASGEFDWENQFENNIWTYDLKDAWHGLQVVYGQIKEKVEKKHNMKMDTVGSIGFSAMMHGYLAFDKNDQLLVPFRTWRNAMTHEAEVKLTSILNHNIPQRWSIAHLYQAILNEETHVQDVTFFTTLAGYIHWQLTGEKVLGIGDASGMFPIDDVTQDYKQEMIETFNQEISKLGVEKDLRMLLPKALVAGADAGKLTEEGAKLLDPTGTLKAGIKLAPPEGDAGTGMVATHAVKPNTGNISAGTSVFAMIVLEEALDRVYPEIDIVTTPLGNSVAMVHVNNCTSEINAWAGLFKDFSNRMGFEVDNNTLYETLFKAAIESDETLEGILTYGYHSGENITNIHEGRPLLVRKPDANFNVANLMRSHIESAFATLNLGMQILFNEGIKLDAIVGHGGIFKTEGVAQRFVAAALETPITLMKTASEGGAWGMAVLAQYMLQNEIDFMTYLDEVIFESVDTDTLEPKEEDVVHYRKFMNRYIHGLEIEKEAIDSFK